MIDPKPSSPAPLLHSIADARRLLGDIGLTKLYDLIGRGRLAAVKIDRSTKITDQSLQACAASLPAAQIKPSIRARVAGDR
jgi:hypothetical protein